MQRFEAGAQVEHFDLRNRGSKVIGWSKYMMSLICAMYDILQVALDGCDVWHVRAKDEKICNILLVVV
jgi:hypothetical protein